MLNDASFCLRKCDSTNLNLSPLCDLLSENNDKKVSKQHILNDIMYLHHVGYYVGGGR